VSEEGSTKGKGLKKGAKKLSVEKETPRGKTVPLTPGQQEEGGAKNYDSERVNLRN